MSAADRPYKLLIVDDESDAVDLFRQRMRRDVDAGEYELLFAGTGVEALEVLARVPDVDLVITDINMPEMDGLTLLDQIPALQPNLRCVILSAYGDMHNIRTAMNRGAFDFVTKPVDFQDLRVTIQRTLKHVREWSEALAARDRLVSLQRELDIASRMQTGILPVEFPDAVSYEVHAAMAAARSVAGDFYDVATLADGRVALAIADVSGKGVPAAMVMMSCRTLLRGALIGMDDPGQVLTRVNEIFWEDNRMSMFVTLFLGVYDPDTAELRCSSAGHPMPALSAVDGNVSWLPVASGPALGLSSTSGYGVSSFSLAEGDLLFVYTDGVTEAPDADGAQFGEGRLLDLLSARCRSGAGALVETVMAAVEDYSGDAEQFDDVTCLALRRRMVATR